MTRHPLRWDALIWGLMFLGVVAAWASWTWGLFDPDRMAYLAAGGLIAVGVAGILGSFAKPGQRS